MTGPDPLERGRLRWRARRGMRELDELLQGWLERSFASAGRLQRAQFDRLLELPDPELARLLLQGGEPADATLGPLLEALRRPPGPHRA